MSVCRLSIAGEGGDIEYERYDYLFIIDCVDHNRWMDLEPYRSVVKGTAHYSIHLSPPRAPHMSAD